MANISDAEHDLLDFPTLTEEVAQKKSEFVDAVEVSALPPGKMKQLKVQDLSLLLVHTKKGIKALDGKCPFEDVNLSGGTFCHDSQGQEVVVCPRCRSVYSAVSGEVIQPLSFKPLKEYPVRIVDGTVQVSTFAMHDHSDINDGIGDDPSSTIFDFADDKNDGVVIVGGGAAGIGCADELRKNGFRGPITMIKLEPELPFARNVLSKAALLSEDPDHVKVYPFCEADYFKLNQIKFLSHAVERINPKTGALELSDGESLKARRVLLATGVRPRKLDHVPGGDLPGVITIRMKEDAQEVIKRAPDATNVVLIGSGLINLEVATSLRQRGVGVTIVSRQELPLATSLGREIAVRLRHLHQDNGIAFVHEEVVEIRGKDKVEAVVFEDGMVIKCSCVIVGIGTVYNTDYAKGTSLPRYEDKTFFIAQNEGMFLGKIKDTSFYTAGDAAGVLLGDKKRLLHVEHLRQAIAEGRAAAREMLGLPRRKLPAPWYWTHQFGYKIEFVGWGGKFDKVEVDGDIRSFSFFATYYEKGKKVGFSSAGIRYVSRMGEAVADFQRMASGITAEPVRKQVDKTVLAPPKKASTKKTAVKKSPAKKPVKKTAKKTTVKKTIAKKD